MIGNVPFLQAVLVHEPWNSLDNSRNQETQIKIDIFDVVERKTYFRMNKFENYFVDVHELHESI